VLPEVPVFDDLVTAINTTRERANWLLRLKLDRIHLHALHTAIADLAAAERLLDAPEAASKPHILRAAHVYLHIAQWRVDGVVFSIDTS
jgi:hypothetical protein